MRCSWPRCATGRDRVPGRCGPAGPGCTMAAMKVVFLSPAYPPEMQQYTRGLAEVGAEVYGIGDSHPQALPPDVKRYLHGYLQVPRIMDEADVIARATSWMHGKSVDRVLANWEPLVILAARMRERWGIPGMSVD